MGLVAMKCPSCGANIELDDSREFRFCNGNAVLCILGEYKRKEENK